MEGSIVGSIVAIRFPFSDLSSTKLRPALVIGLAEFDNLIVCQITSKPYSSKTAIKLPASATNNQLIDSYIRPDKIFTADPGLVAKTVCLLKPSIKKKVQKALKDIISI